jgi:hypothetical protein
MPTGAVPCTLVRSAGNGNDAAFCESFGEQLGGQLLDGRMTRN